MKIVLISIKNFQNYIIDNIKNLKLFGNNDICVITEKKFFYLLENLDVELVDTSSLEDFNYNSPLFNLKIKGITVIIGVGHLNYKYSKRYRVVYMPIYYLKKEYVLEIQQLKTF